MDRSEFSNIVAILGAFCYTKNLHEMYKLIQILLELDLKFQNLAMHGEFK